MVVVVVLEVVVVVELVVVVLEVVVVVELEVVGGEVSGVAVVGGGRLLVGPGEIVVDPQFGDTSNEVDDVELLPAGEQATRSTANTIPAARPRARRLVILPSYT